MTDLEPGRELDALIAEKVMGGCPPETYRAHGPTYFDPPAYSTDIAAAWEVVEMVKDKIERQMDSGKQLSLEMGYCSDAAGGDPKSRWVFQGRWIENGDSWDFAEWGETQPHAICLAALRAIGVR